MEVLANLEHIPILVQVIKSQHYANQAYHSKRDISEKLRVTHYVTR